MYMYVYICANGVFHLDCVPACAPPSTAECSSLRAELDLARQGPQAPVTVLSPPRITEAEM